MARLRRDQVMIAQEMVARDVPVRQVARQLGVDESSLRYRLGRTLDAPDGRQERPSVLDGWDARVDAVLARFDDPRLRGAGEAAVDPPSHDPAVSPSDQREGRALHSNRPAPLGLQAALPDLAPPQRRAPHLPRFLQHRAPASGPRPDPTAPLLPHAV